MKTEVAQYGQPLLLEPSVDLSTSEDNYDPKIQSKRPRGWRDLRSLRNQAREQAQLAAGADEKALLSLKSERIKMV